MQKFSSDVSKREDSAQPPPRKTIPYYSKGNPFAPHMSNNFEDGLLAKPLQRHLINVDKALGGWIRELDVRFQQNNTGYPEEADKYFKDKYKLKYSCDDIRTKKITPARSNLEFLRDGPLYASTSNSEAYSNCPDGIKTKLILPKNGIDLPISKFLLRRDDIDAEDVDFRRKNIHPPAEVLVRAHRPRFDQEAQFYRAFKEWVDIFTKHPARSAAPNPSKSKRKNGAKGAKSGPEVEVRREFLAGRRMDAGQGRDERFANGGCCGHRAPIMPRHQISLPRGVVTSNTNYGDEFCEKGVLQRAPILPIDGMSPPRGVLSGATNYNDQFQEKGNNRRGYIVPPEGMSPPHGAIQASTQYDCEYPEKSYSKREIIVIPGAISPPHGVVSSSTNYTDQYPEKGFCRRELIVLPEEISPPHGKFASDTNYSREFKDCGGNCQREYIIPSAGISPPRGQMQTNTVYNEQYQQKGCSKREPVIISNAISPPKGILQGETTYDSSYRECVQCRGHQFAEMMMSPPCEEANSFDKTDGAGCTYQHDALSRVPHSIHQNGPDFEDRDIWRVDTEELSNLMSFNSKSQSVEHLEQDKAQQRKKKRKSGRRKIKVFQRKDDLIRSLKITPPSSPKPPPSIKKIFATSYNVSYTAAAMRNLN